MRTDYNPLPSASSSLRRGKPQRRGELNAFFFLIGLVFFGSILSGCYRVTSRTDVIGSYQLRAGTNSIDLELSPDQSFKETISWTSGKVEERIGKWYWRPGWVTLDQLWIPKTSHQTTSDKPTFTPTRSSQSTRSLDSGRFQQSEIGAR